MAPSGPPTESPGTRRRVALAVTTRPLSRRPLQPRCRSWRSRCHRAVGPRVCGGRGAPGGRDAPCGRGRLAARPAAARRAGRTIRTAIAPGLEPSPSRSAWCYGDPGIAATLLVAARGAGRPDWEREAVALARQAADRPPAQTRVCDAGLCHGAAGLGHIFNRITQFTRDDRLAAAARHWFTRALDMRQPASGIAGFAALRSGEDGTESWVAERGILTGAAGVGLALLAAVTSFEPAWTGCCWCLRSKRDQAVAMFRGRDGPVSSPPLPTRRENVGVPRSRHVASRVHCVSGNRK
jgi:hypothetical protein